MTDKYPKLRQDLAAAIADAKRQGGVNERAEQIAALLAERDTLAAAPVSAEPVGYVSRDASIARMTTNLPEGSPLYAAPVAAQPDLTQQTLDDVMAGIPARDAEIAALRKDIDTLRAQQDADTVDAERYRAWRDALITGKTAEDDFIRLVADNLPTSVGVSRRPTAAEWDAAIDAARKEQA